MHDDGGFESHHVVAQSRHGAPPAFLDVALEFGSQRTVIPETIQAAVNFRRLENEPAPLRERDDLLHQFARLLISHRAGSVLQPPLDVKLARIFRKPCENMSSR